MLGQEILVPRLSALEHRALSSAASASSAGQADVWGQRLLLTEKYVNKNFNLSPSIKSGKVPGRPVPALHLSLSTAPLSMQRYFLFHFHIFTFSVCFNTHKTHSLPRQLNGPSPSFALVSSAPSLAAAAPVPAAGVRKLAFVPSPPLPRPSVHCACSSITVSSGFWPSQKEMHAMCSSGSSSRVASKIQPCPIGAAPPPRGCGPQNSSRRVGAHFKVRFSVLKIGVY